MIFVGDDWAEDHHDVYLMDETGTGWRRGGCPKAWPGSGRLHELIAAHGEEPAQVVIGIETDRGLWVEALSAAGYQVFAVNPLAVGPLPRPPPRFGSEIRCQRRQTLG